MLGQDQPGGPTIGLLLGCKPQHLGIVACSFYPTYKILIFDRRDIMQEKEIWKDIHGYERLYRVNQWVTYIHIQLRLWVIKSLYMGAKPNQELK